MLYLHALLNFLYALGNSEDLICPSLTSYDQEEEEGWNGGVSTLEECLSGLLFFLQGDEPIVQFNLSFVSFSALTKFSPILS